MLEAFSNVGDAVIASASGMGREECGHIVHVADWIIICNVYHESPEAKKDNHENTTLLKAVGAVGLPDTKGGS